MESISFLTAPGLEEIHLFFHLLNVAKDPIIGHVPLTRRTGVLPPGSSQAGRHHQAWALVTVSITSGSDAVRKGKAGTGRSQPQARGPRDAHLLCYHLSQALKDKQDTERMETEQGHPRKRERHKGSMWLGNYYCGGTRSSSAEPLKGK